MKLIHGDSHQELYKIHGVDTIITDPPYGLSFMGKKWDYDVPSVHFWRVALAACKPGATALVFAGSRTSHRMACNMEDAGWILKDTILWIYGSGFPKATDIKKQIDKSGDGTEWNGWKSHGLKPAYEPIIVAMKPNDGTYANNALKHGVSGLNIDGGRIGTEDKLQSGTGAFGKSGIYGSANGKKSEQSPQGRFPANIILDEEAGEMLDEQSGIKASRFFYTSKASKKERNEGCSDLEVKQTKGGGGTNNTEDDVCGKYGSIKAAGHNHHPTVKPLALMEYLVKLTATPTGGVVLDPFMGSGTTGIACKNQGRDFIGIELDREYFEIAKARTT